jgi:hypothetical protein
MRLVAPVLLLVVVQTASAAELPRPTPLPGGFVDATGQIGVFNTPRGGVQAVELATGKSFWQSQQAQRPLFVSDQRLFALAAVQAPVVRGLCFEWRPQCQGPHNGFRLVAFDLAQFGQVALESETVALPEWASLDEAHDRSCALRWSIENGRLIVAWEANAWYGGLIRKTPQEEAAYGRHAEGCVRFDLETGAFETLAAQAPPVASPAFPLPKELERRVVRWQKTTAKQQLVLIMDEGPGQQTLSLHTFDLATRQRLGVKALLSGQRLTVLPTLDEQYLCLRDPVPSPEIQARDEQAVVQWSIFRADDGQCIAQVPFEPGTTTAAVYGSRVYFLISQRIDGLMDRPFVVPRSLRAVDLKTGTTQWEQPVGGKPSAPPPLIVWPTHTAEAPNVQAGPQP